MIDFITITFNNKLELALLELQANTFSYVENNIINNIIL